MSDKNATPLRPDLLDSAARFAQIKEQAKRQAKLPDTTACRYCGTVFELPTGKGRTRKFCSDECRVANHRAKHRCFVCDHVGSSKRDGHNVVIEGRGLRICNYCYEYIDQCGTLNGAIRAVRDGLTREFFLDLTTVEFIQQYDETDANIIQKRAAADFRLARLLLQHKHLIR